MGIGILFESKEWSSYALHENIVKMGVPAKLIDLQADHNEDEILSCELIVNRIFASAVFRGHQESLSRMPGIIEALQSRNIPMINPYEAHFYEINKEQSTLALAAHGFTVPKVYGVFVPAAINQADVIQYPCVIKPNCGGRTHYTYIARNQDELACHMKSAPDIAFLAEEYIEPEYGYLTRIEVIDRSCKLIVKRSVTENGLSAYHLGSTYTAYSDCNGSIKSAAVRAMDLLQIEAGSMDIIENRNGFYMIDINSVSNASEDNTEMFHFDLMKETAAYAVQRYRILKESQLKQPCTKKHTFDHLY